MSVKNAVETTNGKSHDPLGKEVGKEVGKETQKAQISNSGRIGDISPGRASLEAALVAENHYAEAKSIRVRRNQDQDQDQDQEVLIRVRRNVSPGRASLEAALSPESQEVVSVNRRDVSPGRASLEDALFSASSQDQNKDQQQGGAQDEDQKYSEIVFLPSVETVLNENNVSTKVETRLQENHVLNQESCRDAEKRPEAASPPEELIVYPLPSNNQEIKFSSNNQEIKFSSNNQEIKFSSNKVWSSRPHGDERELARIRMKVSKGVGLRAMRKEQDEAMSRTQSVEEAHEDLRKKREEELSVDNTVSNRILLSHYQQVGSSTPDQELDQDNDQDQDQGTEIAYPLRPPTPPRSRMWPLKHSEDRDRQIEHSESQINEIERHRRLQAQTEA